ncbi:MAG: hypothetical protein QM765_17195 [Myxococcales bacterium]
MQELVRKESIQIAERDKLLVLRYLAAPTLATAQVLADVLRKKLADSPGRQHAFLVIIDAANPVPERAVQEALAKLMREHASQVAAMANVVVGQGFQAAGIRFAMVAMSMLSRPEYPLKGCKSIGEALAWISTTAPQSLAARDVDAVRAEIEQLAS